MIDTHRAPIISLLLLWIKRSFAFKREKYAVNDEKNFSISKQLTQRASNEKMDSNVCNDFLLLFAIFCSQSQAEREIQMRIPCPCQNSKVLRRLSACVRPFEPWRKKTTSDPSTNTVHEPIKEISRRPISQRMLVVVLLKSNIFHFEDFSVTRTCRYPGRQENFARNHVRQWACLRRI